MTEQAVLEIWQALLNVADIGMDDHFFHLGGHSLLATQLIVRLNTRFGTSLDMATPFTATTIAQQTRLIDQAGAWRPPSSADQDLGQSAAAARVGRGVSAVSSRVVRVASLRGTGDAHARCDGDRRPRTFADLRAAECGRESAGPLSSGQAFSVGAVRATDDRHRPPALDRRDRRHAGRAQGWWRLRAARSDAPAVAALSARRARSCPRGDRLQPGRWPIRWHFIHRHRGRAAHGRRRAVHVPG